MKKVISLLTLILCAMLIITGCDPATTTPGTGGNTTIPSNPDDNPLIPDDKPSNDANLPAPTKGHTEIINNLYAKLKTANLDPNCKETFTSTIKTEKIFTDSVHEASAMEGVKSFIANGSLSLTNINMALEINGKVEIKIKDSEETHIYEAKDLELIESSSNFNYAKGELLVDGKLLTEKDISENTELFKYFVIIMMNQDFIPSTESQLASMERRVSLGDFSLHEVSIFSIGNNNDKCTDAVIVTDSKDTLQIGHIVEIGNSGYQPRLDYVSVNNEYISAEKCSEELKQTLYKFPVFSY